MKKYVPFLLLFVAKSMFAFQPPVKEEKPLIKKAGPGKPSKLIQEVHSLFPNMLTIRSMIDKGVLVTPEELLLLLNVNPGPTISVDEAAAHLEFWFNNGIYFLMYGTLSAGEPKSLRMAAAEQVLKDNKRRNQALARMHPELRAMALSADLSAVEKEITHFANQLKDKMRKMQGGPETAQRAKIKEDWGTQMVETQLNPLWEAILNNQPTGVSVIALHYIVQMLSDFRKSIPNTVQRALKKYITDWTQQRCGQVLKITNYLREHDAIQAISEGVKSRTTELATVDRIRVGPLTVQEMAVYHDLNSLLGATEQTCPAIVGALLLRRLGSEAKEILEGKK